MAPLGTSFNFSLCFGRYRILKCVFCSVWEVTEFCSVWIAAKICDTI